MAPSYKHAGVTAQGRRAANEDAVWTAQLRGSEQGVVGVVADGMGGLQFGAEASNAVVTVFREALGANGGAANLKGPALSAALRSSVDEAHRRVCRLSSPSGPASGAGSTVCAALLLANQFQVVHVGDTRCYYINGAEIRRLTQDQSLAAQGAPHVLTNSLGDTSFAGGVLTPEPPLVGVLDERCWFLLATDGVHGVLSDAELHKLVVSTRDRPLTEVAKSVVQRALERGSTDNTSCAILSFQPPHARGSRRWWPWPSRRRA